MIVFIVDFVSQDSKISKRVVFPKGQQGQFLRDVKAKQSLTWKEFEEVVDFNGIRTNYQYERVSLPFALFLRGCELLGERDDSVLENYNAEIIENIGVSDFGKSRKGINPVNISYTKLPSQLDSSEIKMNFWDKRKNLVLPLKLTPLLAEEIGMQLGDGFLSNARTEIRIKGNNFDERDYYDFFVRQLYKKLYNVSINLKQYDSTYGFELSSQGLWKFKVNTLGLNPGKKESLNVPAIVKVNDPEILAAFIRGLFDTDGNVYFQSKYGRKKVYPCLSISQKGYSLLKEVSEILEMLGFNPYFYYDIKRDDSKVILYGITQLKYYAQLIGWNNPKHLNKVKEWRKIYDTGSLNFEGLPSEEHWLESRIVDPGTRVRSSPGVLKFSKENYLSQEINGVIRNANTEC